MKERNTALLVRCIVSIAVTAWSHFATAGDPALADSLNVEVDAVPATARVNPGIQYTTGFELAEGFSLGYISNSGGAPAGCGGVNFPCWAHFAGSDASLITPSISDANPASGLQHLRLIHDPTTRTNQIGFGLGVDARYPRSQDLAPRPAAPNTISVDIAISNPGGMSFRVQPQSPSQGIPSTSVLFRYSGEILIYYGGCEGGIQPTGHYWDTTGAYQNLTISLDPCVPNDEAYDGFGVVHFYYGGELIYTGCPWGTSLEHLIIFGDNYPGSHMDVDNLVMTSLDECPHTCGNGIFEPPFEQCEPGVHECNANLTCSSSCWCVPVCGDGVVIGAEQCEPGNNPTGCNPGHVCGEIGTAEACQCRRTCTLAEPCELHNGANGPFYGPFDATYGGIFIYNAPPGVDAVSVELCGSTGGDLSIEYWGSCTDPNDPGSYNGDCCDLSMCPDGGFGSDPSASCWNNVGAPNFEPCTCHSNPTPGDNCYLLQINEPFGNGQVLIEVNKKARCFLGHVGSCCDTNGADTGCTDNVLQGACVGADKVWTENGKCESTHCACIPNCEGATCGDDGCGGSCGTCDDGNACNGVETCNANRTCDAGVPLACNDGNACNGVETCNPATGCVPGMPLHCDDNLACDGIETCNPQSGCVAGTPVNCDDGLDCTLDTCNEPDGTCTHDDADCAIPTVSQWGLVVLTLVLLVSAKVQFARWAGS